MIALITIVIILACVVLGFFVLVQNPKGGGLSGTFGGISTQMMGVKQSTDVMEKGTWTAMSIVGALSIIIIMFYATPVKEQGGKEAQQTSQPAKKGK